MTKTLSQLFYKYVPTDTQKRILDEGRVIRSRVDKENRIIEVYAEFDRIIPKATLYEIEDQIRDAYKIQFCT